MLLALAAFGALALLTHDDAALLRIDRPIMRAVQSTHWPPYDWVLTHVSDLGFAPLGFITYAVVFAGLYVAGRRFEAVMAVASSALAGVACDEIKQIVGRPRPSGAGIHVAAHLTDFGFPSGHVTHYATLFGFAFYAVAIAWRPGLLRHLVLALLAVLILLVGPSRVYLGEHWPSDVLGAYLFAGAWLAGTIQLYRLLRR